MQDIVVDQQDFLAHTDLNAQEVIGEWESGQRQFNKMVQSKAFGAKLIQEEASFDEFDIDDVHDEIRKEITCVHCRRGEKCHIHKLQRMNLIREKPDVDFDQIGKK